MKIEKLTTEIDHELLDLLLTADPNERLLKKYIENADVLIAKVDNLRVGIAVLTNLAGEFELKNIAVTKEYQNKGIAKELINEIKQLAKAKGANELLVGTGNSSLNQLALYQKCGFRMDHIKKDFFLDYPEDIIENNIPCQDLVILKVKL